MGSLPMLTGVLRDWDTYTQILFHTHTASEKVWEAKRNRPCTVFLKSTSVSFFHNVFFSLSAFALHSAFLLWSDKGEHKLRAFQIWSAVAIWIRMAWLRLQLQLHILSVLTTTFANCFLCFTYSSYHHFDLVSTSCHFCAWLLLLLLWITLRSVHICGGGCCFPVFVL